MFKYSAPLNISTLKDEDLPKFHEYFQKCNIERVFFGLPDYLFEKSGYIFRNAEKVKRQMNYFRERGYEVCIWALAFGHGKIEINDGIAGKFTNIESFDGKKSALCPLDENFIQCMADGIKKLAAFEPSIIMLDDDYRIHIRGAHHFCCCELHMTEYKKRIGEDISKEELEKHLLTGGPNRYRTEWQKLMGETLVNFAKRMREALDEANPEIRLGHCSCNSTWDFDGTDNAQISLAFAGKTKPFLRTIGAPYHGVFVANAVENTRLQASWCKKYGIEVFAEGDTYVRPRYNVPSSRLELFDMGLLASGEVDGHLKYMFDYARPIDYETGYADRHIKNNESRQGIREIFEGKKNVGVRVFEELHKIENWELPEEKHPQLVAMLERANDSKAQTFISRNAIPTVYGETEYTYIVFGENARYISEEELSKGAIIDLGAARILNSRGIDTGYISSEPQSFTYENFDKEGDYIERIGGFAFHNVKCNEAAEVLTHLMPGDCTGTYRYENKNGQRFMVFPFDAYTPSAYDNISYACNYYRQKQLSDGVEWLCGKKLPAKLTKGAPMLYMQASENEDKSAMSVLLLNSFDDYEIDVEVQLAKEYKTVRFVNCNGKLCKDKVIIEKIDAHGFAAFEVKE